jgi:hypothetical protein
MEENQNPNPEILAELKQAFRDALETAHRIFGTRTFQIKEPNGRWSHSQALYDAVMVSLDSMREHSQALYRARSDVQRLLADALTDEKTYEVIVGRPNTAAAIKDRITLVGKLFKKAIQ